MITIKDEKPQVGIFELLDNTLCCLSQEMNPIDAVGGAVDAGNLFHRDLCRQALKTENLSTRTKDIINSQREFWTKFPRGRVWYSVDEKIIMYQLVEKF